MENDVTDTMQDNYPMPDSCLEMIAQLAEIITLGWELEINISHEEVKVVLFDAEGNQIDWEIVGTGTDLLETLNARIEEFELAVDD